MYLKIKNIINDPIPSSGVARGSRGRQILLPRWPTKILVPPVDKIPTNTLQLPRSTKILQSPGRQKLYNLPDRQKSHYPRSTKILLPFPRSSKSFTTPGRQRFYYARLTKTCSKFEVLPGGGGSGGGGKCKVRLWRHIPQLRH